MEKNKNVPPLRFAGFTDDWEQRKLGEVLKIKSGMSQKDVEVENGIYPILATGGEIGRTNTALYSKESVLIGRKGTIDKPYYMNTPFWTVDTLFYSELSSYVTGQFIYTLFQKIKWRDFDTSTGVPSLTSATIHSIEVKIPSKTEQTAIGNFFKQLDETIALHQRECEKYQNLKKSYLDKMFPKENELFPELRFPEFTDAWEQRKLGDLGKVLMCKRIFKEETNENGDIPFYKIGTFGAEADSYISIELFEEYKNKYPYPQKGDILISAAGTIGRCIFYKGENAYYQDSNIVWLKTNKTEIVSSFLYYFYSVAKWNGIEGSTIQRLYNSNILSTKINLPSLSEQTAIGNFFKQLDETIALHQRELEKYKQIKQSYLEKMFV